MRSSSFCLTLTLSVAASLAACQSETRRPAADAPPPASAPATVTAPAAPSVEPPLPSAVSAPAPARASQKISKPTSFSLAPAPPSVEPLPAALQGSFLRSLAKPSQWFKVNPTRDTVLRFAEGGSLTIPAGALRTRNGRIAGPVKLEVREYYSTADIVLNRLSTTAQGRLLETGGMVYLAVTAAPEPCEVAPGAKLTLQLPARPGAPAMELFRGRPDALGIVDWVAAGQPIRPPLATKARKVAEFPGGDMELVRVLSAKIRYPAIALRRGEQGTAIVKFTVSENGLISNPKIDQSTGSASLDTAAIKAVSKLPRFTPATIDGVPTTSTFRTPIVFFIEGMSGAMREAAIKEQEKALAAANDSSLARASSNTLSSYVITLANLGWINCDRFLDSNVPKVNYAVAGLPSTSAQVLLVFTETNSVMVGNWHGGQCKFGGVPLGARATIVAFKEHKTGALLATKPVQLTTDPERDLTFRPVTVAGLRQAIAAVK